MEPDYLIVGSCISALAFGALMARSGRSVQIDLGLDLSDLRDTASLSAIFSF